MAELTPQKRRYRVSADGKIVLQVLPALVSRGYPRPPREPPNWRDATLEDLTEHEPGKDPFHG